MGFRSSTVEGLAMSLAEQSDVVFWSGKRVLVTGHSGFKGAWLVLCLHRLGAHVTGISLPPETSPNLFSLANIGELCVSHFCDIRDVARLADLVGASSPQIVFHLAAQALVRTGYRDPLTTFSTNVLGTAHVLDTVRSAAGLRVVVAVTSDKVYKNREAPYAHRESDELAGHDPYGASKAAAEMIIAGYRDAYLAGRGVAVASARAGNVIGGGDWSADRLIPDAVRAWYSGQPLRVRRPRAVRPWQHVLEPLHGYLRLAEKLYDQPSLAGAYNFGPEARQGASVREVVELASEAHGQGAEVLWEDDGEGPQEAGWLALDVARARTVLGVSPCWTLPQAISHTMAWYRRLAAGISARAACAVDLAAYRSAWDGRL